MQMTVLLVEDDHGLRDVLARALREEGFRVTTAVDGRSALASAADPPAAVVLDVGLPDSDGRDVCAALRAQGMQAPVLFLTARDGLHDRLSGFAAGGDDYLTKPFHVSELVARLRALLKRATPEAAQLGSGIVLDPSSHALSRGDSEVPLTPTEFRLLACLLAASGDVVRRRELISSAWPAGAIVAENTLDQYVTRLRRKLVEAGSTRGLKTVRGVGYRLG
ncbi:MAG: two-component system response regulator [Frankiales bacterium]|nr:two-component system response regulator [Frankiales bacterium]